MAAGIVNIRRDVDDKFYRYRCVIIFLSSPVLVRYRGGYSLSVYGTSSIEGSVRAADDVARVVDLVGERGSQRLIQRVLLLVSLCRLIAVR